MKKFYVLFLACAMALSWISFDLYAQEELKKPKKSATVEKKAEKEEKKADKKAEKEEKKADKKAEKAEKKAEKKEYMHKKSADEKELGKDEKGRMIYEGPRGGHYYYTDHGTKVYIKNDDK